MSQPVGRTSARRLRVEGLEDRTVPSWGSTPPSSLALPSSFTSVTLNSSGDAAGTASITNNEIDWYQVTVPAGPTIFSATTPSSRLDTVLGVYNAAGTRVAYNDDISRGKSDSRTSATLPAGTYYVGVTNYTGTAGGSYSWAIDGPSVSPPPTSPPPPPPTTGGFEITVRLGSGLTATQQTVFQQAAARWASVITGDLPDATYGTVIVDDVLIDASGVSIDGAGGILGQAGPDRLRSGSYLPYHGVMQFDGADLASLEASGQLFNVIVHEMGHVLGIGTIWQQKGLLAGAGTSNPQFLGAQATAAYNTIFGTTGTSVPVENSGGSGTRDGHWREATFANELMTGYLNSGTNPLSRVTVGSLGDLGYQVNLAAADSYTPPGGGGFALTSGGGTTGGAGLQAGNDLGGGCGCSLCQAMLDTVATVAPAVGVSPVGVVGEREAADVVAVVVPAPVRRATTPATESDRPAPTTVASVDPVRAVRTTAAATADVLLGSLVG